FFWFQTRFRKTCSPRQEGGVGEKQKRDAKILKYLALIGIPLAVAFHGGVGSLFATVATQEIWHNPMTPILFLLGALFSGGALLTGLVVFFWPNKNEEWKTVVSYLGRVVLLLG